MAYEPTVWKNRVVERPLTFNMVNNPDGTVTLVPAPGVIVESGTPVNAVNLNKLEQGLKTHEADIATENNSGHMSNTDKIKLNIINTQIITGSYTGDGTGNRLINTGFKPLFVLLLMDEESIGAGSVGNLIINDEGKQNFVLSTGTNNISANSNAFNTNNGFQVVGASGNRSGIKYKWIAFKEVV